MGWIERTDKMKRRVRLQALRGSIVKREKQKLRACDLCGIGREEDRGGEESKRESIRPRLAPKFNNKLLLFSPSPSYRIKNSIKSIYITLIKIFKYFFHLI